jgi:hypothetical protein
MGHAVNIQWTVGVGGPDRRYTDIPLPNALTFTAAAPQKNNPKACRAQEEQAPAKTNRKEPHHSHTVIGKHRISKK